MVQRIQRLGPPEKGREVCESGKDYAMDKVTGCCKGHDDPPGT